MGEELGGFREAMPESPHTALTAFRGYADHMDTDGFRDALARLIETSRDTPTAVMCAESVWWRCHRQLIADALVAAGCDVVHLLDAGPQPHTLHPAARIEGGRPVYDVGTQSSLDV